MRKNAFLLILPLILVAPAAHAEWRLVFRDSLSAIYLDPDSRKTQTDGSILVRALTDYDPHSPDAASFGLSQKGLSEIEDARFDCASHAYRSGGGAWFSGQMATGVARSSYPAKESWSKIPPFYEALAAKLCGAP